MYNTIILKNKQIKKNIKFEIVASNKISVCYILYTVLLLEK